MWRIVLTLLVLAACVSAAVADVGDVYNPAAEFALGTMPAPWSYLCQEGTSVWDGTYNFTPMVTKTSGTSGSTAWWAPNSSDFYGPQCGMFPYYGNLTVNSYKVINHDYGVIPGVGILGFTAPFSGTYNIKGGATGYNSSCDGYAWINSPRSGEVWKGRVTGDYTVTWPKFDLNVELAAGESIYWGSTIISGNSVYGIYETYPIYWNFNVTQTAAHDVPPVPEPTSLLVLGSGLASVMGFAARRKR